MNAKERARVRRHVAVLLRVHGKIHDAAPRGYLNSKDCPLAGHDTDHDWITEILHPGQWRATCPFCGKVVELE